MPTYLFTWNPDRWDWESLEEDSAFYKRRGYLDGRWSCGVTKRIVPGDRAFLIKLGKDEPKGIMASGFAVSAPFEALHYSDPTKTANYTNLRYDVLLNPRTEGLLQRSLLLKELPDMQWNPQGSGITIAGEVAARLEELWQHHLASIGFAPQQIPDEVSTPERYSEGALRRIAVNAYERDPRARKACIDHHGTNCSICGLSFGEHFGAIGEGFIHVHHLRFGRRTRGAKKPAYSHCRRPSCRSVWADNAHKLSAGSLRFRCKCLAGYSLFGRFIRANVE